MKRLVVRYKTKPEMSDANAQLIQEVFKELTATAPPGVRYLALRLQDGSFLHLSALEGEAPNPIPQLAAFRLFQRDIKDRCLEPPQAREATIIGNYRMLSEAERRTSACRLRVAAKARNGSGSIACSASCAPHCTATAAA